MQHRDDLLREFLVQHLGAAQVPLRLWLIRAAKWLVPAWRCFTLPLAVTRKRFLTPLWVFCLGMMISAEE